MEKLRVVELKEIAKSKGLHGYSRLCKAELINFIKSNTSKGIVIFTTPRGEIIFLEESEQSAGSFD